MVAMLAIAWAYQSGDEFCAECLEKNHFGSKRRTRVECLPYFEMAKSGMFFSHIEFDAHPEIALQKIPVT